MDFKSKKTELFTKVGEIAHKFGAEAAVMIISGDQKNIYTLTSSDFLKKLVKCTETENPPAFHQFRPEGDDVLVPVKIGFLRDIAQSLSETQMELLDISKSGVDINPLIGVEQQLRDRLTIIEKRMEEQLLQEIDKLKRQVEEIQCLLPSTSTSAAPIATDGGPGNASIVGPQVSESLTSTSTSAAPIATDRGPGPASIVGPQVNESMRSTSTYAATMATDNSQRNLDLSDEDVDTKQSLRDPRVELVEAIFLIALSWTAVFMSIAQQLS